ncbi:hypothetical protein [Alkalihalobacillus sp. LMS39]|uniref:hypothetical protein n=1 Tax=Alkalihalobacillus sp. LMS39 TaxID=2924032 RepID=UPI001FB44719|nr:hypothetical protein [Alkalihalobacillus sp. LMS39]UOE95719.1 hypothetical protein MM271_09000 [Alkalihalobacillus sp. LMS39]
MFKSPEINRCLTVLIQNPNALYVAWDKLLPKQRFAELVLHTDWNDLDKMIRVLTIKNEVIFEQCVTQSKSLFLSCSEMEQIEEVQFGVKSKNGGFLLLEKVTLSHQEPKDNNKQVKIKKRWQEGFSGYSISEERKNIGDS